MASFWDVQNDNRLRSYLLVGVVLAVIFVLVWTAGQLFEGGEWIAPFALVFSLLYAVGGYWWGDKIVLAVSRAHEADEKEYAYLHNTAEGLAIAAGMPKPKLYVIEDASPNAFATGRDPKHASIAVTTGLLARMNRAELEGVLSHEMSHIRNYDSRFMTAVIVLVGLVSILANLIGRGMFFGFMGGRRDERRGGDGLQLVFLAIGILLVIFGPLLAQLVRLAISRKREFLADASGAQLTRNPDGLANALEKLRKSPPMQNANATTAPLFISDPTGAEEKKGIADSIANLFSTHPPLEERIKILRAM